MIEVDQLIEAKVTQIMNPALRSSQVPDDLAVDSSRLLDRENERLCRLYKFLFSLTDMGNTEKSNISDPKNKKSATRPNESLIAEQWGGKKHRIFVRRLLRAVYPEKYLDEKDYLSHPEPLPRLELYKLISILVGLEHYKQQPGVLDSAKRRKNRSRDQSLDPTQQLTHADKLKALRLFSELSLYERQLLGMPWRTSEALLQQLLKETAMASHQLSDDTLKQLYRTFIQHSQLLDLSNQKTSNPKITSPLPDVIRSQIRNLLRDYPNRATKLDEYEEKVNRELNRIRLQSGLQHIEGVENKLNANQVSNTPNITVELIQRLTKSVVENEILTEEFPIFIKYVEVKKVRPLPLHIHDESTPDGLLDRSLSDVDEGLERQISYRVRVYFYARLRTLDDVSLDGDATHFYEEITGIGSPISHVTAAINRTLLWDIPCLREEKILPIAKQLFLNDEIIGDSHNSPVWSHCVVQLCREDLVKKAIELGESYDAVDMYAEPAHGDFCGFDMLEAVAKASLNARLRAIQQLGVDPDRYLEELGCRISEAKILRKAKKALKFYPFSVWAMEGILEAHFLKDKKYYRNYSDKPVEGAWSKIAYDAQLSMAEALLIEGKYTAAKDYLDVLTLHMDCNNFAIGELMKARYHVLLAQYHYQYDLSGSEMPNQVHDDRTHAVRAVIDELKQAKDCLRYRVSTCQLIDEVPQINTHPYSSLLSKIYFLEARLNLAFHAYLKDELSDGMQKVMSYLQKARICAAQDGSTDDYAEYSTFQSWLYLMMAQQQDDVNRESYLDWSRRLLNHAMRCYSETGEQAYKDLKNHSGDSTYRDDSAFPNSEQDSYEVFGGTRVQAVPFLQERATRYRIKSEVPSMPSEIILNLDLSLLKEKRLQGDSPNVYLFGTHASLLLMVDGLQELISKKKSGLDIAMKKILAAYSMAKDGGHTSKDEGIPTLARDFNPLKFDEDGISSIKGLYPHRISFVVALSSVFLIICAILKILQSYSCYYHDAGQKWNDFENEHPLEFGLLNTILVDIHEAEDVSQSETLKNFPCQNRFNGHLDTHLLKITRYFQAVLQGLDDRNPELGNLFVTDLNQSNTDQYDEIVQRSCNYLLKDTFSLIRGAPDVSFWRSIKTIPTAR